MLGCPKGKRSQRYHRKMSLKDPAKKTCEAGKTLSSFARGKLPKKKKTGGY